MTTFTTREVAKILGLPEPRVRACVRAGLVTPRRGTGRQHLFEFQDLLLLKTTKDLLDARIPVKRIRRMLGSLRRQLPDDQNLGSITIFADGRRIVAWDGTAKWQPDSGQFLFNFDVQEVAEKVALPAAERPEPRRLEAKRLEARRAETKKNEAPALSADQWFHLGAELEGTSPEEARRAYEQALELDPALADAHVNLGRLYHQAKDHAKAEGHYRAAIRLAPDDPVPRFNLGGLLDDLGQAAEAVQAYRQAIERDPEFADAHYNLARLYETQGRRAEAFRHFQIARKLYNR